MATLYDSTREGFVQNYRIESTISPSKDTYYFELELNSKIEGDGSKTTWGLPRNNNSDLNLLNPNSSSSKYYAISYGNTHQAIIATIKDALHNGNKVKLFGKKLRDITIFENPINIEDPQIGIERNTGGGSPEAGPFNTPGSVGGAILDPNVPGTVPEDDIPHFELRQVIIYKK